MNRKAVSGMIAALLLISILTLAFSIQPVKALGTIYIRPDGSIYPSTAPIVRNGGLYTFTDNIFGSLVVERNSIVVDGAGYNLDGEGSEWIGIELYNLDNVTIKNMEIREFEYGIDPTNCHDINLSQNIIADNHNGIYITQSSGSTLAGNLMSGNTYSLGVAGFSLSEFMHTIDTSNRVDGKPVHYLVNRTDELINPETYPEVGYLGLINCINITVERLNLSNNEEGLLLAYTNNSRITANRVVNNGIFGVPLLSSSNNTLAGNNITANSYGGIVLQRSSNNRIVGNTFTNNGLLIFDSYENSVEGNVVNGKPLVYLEDVSEYTVDYAGEVVLINCADVRVENLDLSNASGGVQLLGTNNSRITNNTIESNNLGISLDWSTNNTFHQNNIANNTFGFLLFDGSDNEISGNNIEKNSDSIFSRRSSNCTFAGNNITYNGWGLRISDCNNTTISRNSIANNTYAGIDLSYDNSQHNVVSGNNIANNGHGIDLHFSLGNIIYHNNFINNTMQVFSYESKSTWDNGYPSGGNYWSDYEEKYPNAAEIDESSIWDIPYVIDTNNQDNYPLMEPYSPIPRTTDELKTEIEELGLQNEIDNHGIVTSLIAKLSVAQKSVENDKIDQAKNILNAFINEVQAQSGKHITPEAADILIESAEYIISHL